MVVQFVAFVGAYRDPGSLNPWVAAVLASLLTTWVTFVPCFLFILLGAPYVERLRHNRNLSSALTGITAAVVGVIASLAAFFAVHTLFDQTRHDHRWTVRLPGTGLVQRPVGRRRGHGARLLPDLRPRLVGAPHPRRVRRRRRGAVSAGGSFWSDGLPQSGHRCGEYGGWTEDPSARVCSVVFGV